MSDSIKPPPPLPEGPRPDPTRAGRAIRDAAPKGRVTHAAVHDILADSYAILRRELAEMRKMKSLSPQQIRSLVDLTRAAKEVRALEQITDDEIEEELSKVPDADLRKRT